MIDPRELAEIWDAHAERLLIVARAFGGPAEDAVQEAFVALARQPRLPDDPMAWLVRVARNELLQWQRGQRRRRARESMAGESASWFDGQLGSVDRLLDGREVTKALLTIASPQREVIVMHLWGDMSFESIAAVIGTSRASAHRAFTRGLETLKERFHCESERDLNRLYHE